MGTTPNFGLKTLGPGEPLSSGSYQFTLRDPQVVDAVLHASFIHKHTGETLLDPIESPDPPDVSIDVDSEGILLSDTAYYYKISLVDEHGRESEASDEVLITTPTTIGIPSAATAEASATGGTLGAGTHLYTISRYQGDIWTETFASPSVAIVVPRGGIGSVILTLPALGDADGFNVYRKKPNGYSFYYVGSTDEGFFDDNGLLDDCNRFPPQSSSIDDTHSVLVEYPGVLPDGYLWKVYRSTVTDLWDNTLIATVPGDDEFLDLGSAGGYGTPDAAAVELLNPEKVLLTDGDEVQGLLPASMVEGGGHGYVGTEYFYVIDVDSVVDLTDIGISATISVATSATDSLSITLPDPATRRTLWVQLAGEGQDIAAIDTVWDHDSDDVSEYILDPFSVRETALSYTVALFPIEKNTATPSETWGGIILPSGPPQDLFYDPTTPGDWPDVVPSTTGEALDEIAVRLTALEV